MRIICVLSSEKVKIVLLQTTLKLLYSFGQRKLIFHTNYELCTVDRVLFTPPPQII